MKKCFLLIRNCIKYKYQCYYRATLHKMSFIYCLIEFFFNLYYPFKLFYVIIVKKIKNINKVLF